MSPRTFDIFYKKKAEIHPRIAPAYMRCGETFLLAPTTSDSNKGLQPDVSSQASVFN